jgi:hypothetical protein
MADNGFPVELLLEVLEFTGRSALVLLRASCVNRQWRKVCLLLQCSLDVRTWKSLPSLEDLESLSQRFPRARGLDLSAMQYADPALTDTWLQTCVRCFPATTSFSDRYGSAIQLTDDGMAMAFSTCHLTEVHCRAGKRTLATIGGSNLTVLGVANACSHFDEADLLKCLQDSPCLAEFYAVRCVQLSSTTLLNLGRLCPKMRLVNVMGNPNAFTYDSVKNLREHLATTGGELAIDYATLKSK